MTANILGISAFYHDSAACLVVDGDVVAAAQEERFSREKYDAAFPVHAIDYCLNEAGLTADRLDYIAFYDKPLVKFDRLLETYFAYAPSGLASFCAALPGSRCTTVRAERRGKISVAPISTDFCTMRSMFFPFGMAWARVMRARRGGVTASCRICNRTAAESSAVISAVASRPCPSKRTTRSPG